MLNLPNTLTIVRLGIVPVLIWCAWKGDSRLFLGLLIFAFITDVLDGYIARTFNLQTPLGAKLDSLADFAVYMSLPLCAWLLWPDVIQREIVFVLAIVLSILVPVLLGILKFGSYPSYHTWLTKIAAAAMACASIYLFLGGPAWFFRLAAILCVLAASEEILITLILKHPRTNVRSVWDVIRGQKSF